MQCIMTNANSKSDIEQAVDEVSPNNVKDNLNNKDKGDTESPENLSEQEQTPFIDEELRTDK